ncbi:MAG: Bax inhibitor-1/YccA family protein [Treponema sp.]
MNTTFFDSPLQQGNEYVIRGFLTRVYGWMVAALAVSGISAAVFMYSRPLQMLVYGNAFGFWILVLAQFALVTVLSAGIRKMSFPVAAAVFTGYSILNGITLSSVLFFYTTSSVVHIFIVTALLFGCMSLYGATTKSNLLSVGKYLMMGLIGIMIAIGVNIFLRSSPLDWLISFVMVIVFTGLTAYDSQKMMHIALYSQNNDQYKKLALVGALELYLDFINIFIALLRLFGKRR